MSKNIEANLSMFSVLDDAPVYAFLVIINTD